MDPIAEFGPYLVEYSGTANVTYRQGEQEIVYEGTFEARQSESARVVVVFRPVSQHLPSGGATFRITNPLRGTSMLCSRDILVVDGA